MLINNYKKESREKRHRSLRKRIEGTAERPRLAIFRSSRHIYAQVIDDLQNKTLVGTSDLGLESAKDDAKDDKGGKKTAASVDDENLMALLGEGGDLSRQSAHSGIVFQ